MSHFLYKFHMFLEQQYWKKLETVFDPDSIKIERFV